MGGERYSHCYWREDNAKLCNKESSGALLLGFWEVDCLFAFRCVVAQIPKVSPALSSSCNVFEVVKGQYI